MKGVFTSKRDTGYDDRIEERYHFPRRYLAEAREVVSDWIVYHESKRGGGAMAYIGAARVDDFMPFPKPVPLRHGSGFFESRLNAVSNPAKVGAVLQGSSIRTISDVDFAAIVMAGLHAVFDPAQHRRLDVDSAELPKPRQIERVLASRIVREANFRDAVTRAYDDTCAFTGVHIVNGGGHAEVQAAHIWPVAEGGPDVVRNGVALSSTVHWMFDRRLISIADDYGILISHNKVPSEWLGMFARQQARIKVPKNPRDWPHPEYLKRHRAVLP